MYTVIFTGQADVSAVDLAIASDLDAIDSWTQGKNDFSEKSK